VAVLQSGRLRRANHKAVVICDPLHLLKRIRYRLLEIDRSDSPQETLTFSISVVRNANILSPVVVNTSPESMMHGSLLLE
jgi:hypothetical protein